MRKRKKEPARLGVNPARLGEGPKAMGKSLRIRISQEEHDKMIAVAKSYGLTVSEYIRQLHRQATTTLRKRRAIG